MTQFFTGCLIGAGIGIAIAVSLGIIWWAVKSILL